MFEDFYKNAVEKNIKLLSVLRNKGLTVCNGKYKEQNWGSSLMASIDNFVNCCS